MYTSISLLPLLLASGALADSLFAIKYDIVAYVLGSQADTITYAVACTKGSDPDQCGFVQPMTLIESPNTLSFTMTIPDKQTATLGCTLPASTSISCSATGLALSTPTPMAATTTFSGAGVPSLFKSVSIVSDSASLMTYPTTTSTSTSCSTTTTEAAAPTFHLSAPSNNATVPFALIIAGNSGMGKVSASGSGLAKPTASGSVGGTTPQVLANAGSAMKVGVLRMLVIVGVVGVGFC